MGIDGPMLVRHSKVAHAKRQRSRFLVATRTPEKRALVNAPRNDNYDATQSIRALGWLMEAVNFEVGEAAASMRRPAPSGAARSAFFPDL